MHRGLPFIKKVLGSFLKFKEAILLTVYIFNEEELAFLYSNSEIAESDFIPNYVLKKLSQNEFYIEKAKRVNKKGNFLYDKYIHCYYKICNNNSQTIGIIYAIIPENKFNHFVNIIESNYNNIREVLEFVISYRKLIEFKEEKERVYAEIEIAEYELKKEQEVMRSVRRALQNKVRQLQQKVEAQEMTNAELEIKRASLEEELQKVRKAYNEIREKAQSLRIQLERSEKERAELEIQRYMLMEEKETFKNIALQLRQQIEFSEKKFAELEIKQAELKMKLEEFYEQEKSIDYARYLQNNLLPSEKEIQQKLPGSYIFFKALHKLSGDFYLFREYKEGYLIGVGDSTGHGIPAALLSFMFLSAFQHIIELREMMFQWVGKTLHDNETAEILEQLRFQTRKLMSSQAGKKLPDSIDFSLVIYNPHQNYILYSGAMLPALLIFPDGNVKLLEPTKCPIGHYPKELPFSTKKVENVRNARLYLFTDGYYSQQSPKYKQEKRKTFGKKNFYKLLTKIHHLPPEDQKDILNKILHKWKGFAEQSDDITIFSVQL